MIKLVIADDHPVFRKGIRHIIEADDSIEIADEAGTGREAIEICQNVQPHIVLLDLMFPDIDGISVTQQLRISCPKTRILILTANENHETAMRALKAGAHGYVVKDIFDKELLSAVHAVLRNNTYISPGISQKVLLDSLHGGSDNPFEMLSIREHTVISRLSKGETVKEIATSLGISPSTAETHKYRAMQKLDLKNHTELVRLALKHGIIE